MVGRAVSVMLVCLVFEVQNVMKDLDGAIGEEESQVIRRLSRSAAHCLGLKLFVRLASIMLDRGNYKSP